MFKNYCALAATLLCFNLLPDIASAQATTACSQPVINTDTHGHVNCYSSDGFQKYTFFQIALCKEEPTHENYEQLCDFLLNDNAGNTVELSSSGTSASLTNGSDVSIPEGIYTHAALLIDERIGLKGAYTFDKPLIGKSKIPGNQCWTTSGTWNEFYASNPGYCSISDMPFECGTEAEPEYLFAHYDAFSFSGFDVYAIPNRVSPTGSYGMYVLDSNKSLPSNGSGDLSGDYLFGLQTFNDPIIISPNTRSIELGFKLTNMFNIETNFRDTRFNNSPADCGRNSRGENACLVMVIPQGFEFTVTAR